MVGGGTWNASFQPFSAISRPNRPSPKARSSASWHLGNRAGSSKGAQVDASVAIPAAPMR